MSSGLPVKPCLKILAVDDNPSINQSMGFIFAPPLYDVTSARDGDEALGKLAISNDFDVIIVDQKMPCLTGLQLVQEMKERGIGGKIVVLSAQLSPEIRDAYHQMGVHFIVAKPFNIAELRSVVSQAAA